SRRTRRSGSPGSSAAPTSSNPSRARRASPAKEGGPMLPALALQSASAGSTALVPGGAVVVLLIFLLPVSSRDAKVGPNEALIVSGFRGRTIADGDGRPRHLGFRWVKGGGTFVFPVVERAEALSLELMTLDVKTPEVYSITGVPLVVDGVAQVKV